MPRINLKEGLILAASIIICQVAGIVGSVFTVSAVNGWYTTLYKPFFSPPNWVFAPVWIFLYTTMGISLFLILRRVAPGVYKNSLLLIFIIQLALNSFWSIAFFGLRNIFLGLTVILLLLLFIGLLIYALRKVQRIAAVWLYPYFLWVAFATLLNFSLWILNK